MSMISIFFLTILHCLSDDGDPLFVTFHNRLKSRGAENLDILAWVLLQDKTLLEMQLSELNILYWFKSMKPLLIFVYIDDDRVYGFLRVIAGDELSKRTKFALIVWLGKNVSGIKRARMGTDKSSVKEVIRVSSLIVYRFQMSILPGVFFFQKEFHHNFWT